MPAAIRSVFTASVVFAATGVIAVSPLAPAPEVHIPTVQIPGIELTAAPAFGAIPTRFWSTSWAMASLSPRS